jgi:predicted ArsR family transcriptional regulator
MRPAGTCRIALLAVLNSGKVGQVDDLAAQAGVPVAKAGRLLSKLCREGVAAAQPQTAPTDRAMHRQVGRPRVVYSVALPPAERTPFDSLNFARHVWR